MNKGSVSSQVALWEAHKVVIRSHCIAIGTRVNTLNLQLKPEAKLATSPTRRTLRWIREVRSKLKTIALGKTEKLLLYSWFKGYVGFNTLFYLATEKT